VSVERTTTLVTSVASVAVNFVVAKAILAFKLKLADGTASGPLGRGAAEDW
jgi:hypothetical protein